MELYQQLKQLGLEEKQARVYLASLELGPDTVLNIAYKSDIKRPTTYVILEELIKKGLIAITPKKKTTLYTAENPKKILTQIKQREKIFKKISPLLQALNNQKASKPKVMFYEGKEGVRRAYDDIYKVKEIWFFASIKKIQNELNDVLEKFDKTIASKQIKSLICNQPEDIEYSKKMIKLKNYETKILPKKYKSFSIDCAIYENKIAIFSYFKKELMAIVIENQGIADSFKTIHQLAWESAEPFRIK
ncbi:MAG: hypothetical protein HQ538_01860 [Parcubacteria group bacterium]|nr:hypothetical protein [Parcubacteria group bacterium]